MKTKKEIINIELGESGLIDVSVGIGTNKTDIIEEIRKGINKAFSFFNNLLIISNKT